MLDDELIERLQRAAFDYFVEQTNPANGLVADTSRDGAPASIAVVGMGLAVLVVASERGWLARQDAAARALVSLRFFESSPQGTAVTGYRGFYYHFLDRVTGQRARQCELSPIDTALLVAGVLTVGAYFSADTADEKEVRALGLELYGRVDWDWARAKWAGPTITVLVVNKTASPMSPATSSDGANPTLPTGCSARAAAKHRVSFSTRNPPQSGPRRRALRPTQLAMGTLRAGAGTAERS
jgi:hypothetical protein